MNKIKIENVVFCDHVRAEVGGKYTLIGASGPELNASQLPGFISIALWICGTAPAAGKFGIDVRLLNVDKKPLFEGHLVGEIGVGGKCIFALGPIPFEIQKAGDYRFEWKFSDQKWSKIATLRINYVAPDAEPRTVPAAI